MHLYFIFLFYLPCTLTVTRDCDGCVHAERKLRHYQQRDSDYVQYQRIYINREGTAPPFVIDKCVFLLREPEAVRKTTPELLLAEW